jgi:hypothetical protein
LDEAWQRRILTKELNKKAGMMKRRKGRSTSGAVLAIVFWLIFSVLIVQTGVGCSPMPSATTPPSKPPTHTTTIAPTDYKGWLRWTVEREIGAESNLKVSRVRDITFETADESEPVLDIVADDNLSHGFIRTGMLLDAKKVFRAVFADNRASKLTVGMFFPMIDAYGNSETTILMDIQMSRETAEKINWDNFLTDNLPLVADYFYERPGW